MPLISMSDAWLSFSDVPLLNNAEIHIENHERICLIGRNGAGKSTLLKILNKEIPLDNGRIIYDKNLIITRLPQDLPCDINRNVFDFVAEGVSEQVEHLKRYHAISQLIGTEPNDKNLVRMAQIMEIIDYHGLWQLDKRIKDVLLQLGLNGDATLSSLSGGWLRKAALGRALVSSPHVLLLDEPTNHLDIKTITWMERFLRDFQGSIAFISHDRSFIRNLATRIVDLDRGKLVSWPGNYDLYLLNKAEELRISVLQNGKFDRQLTQEEAWIRQGIKARRTRNEGRARILKALRNKRAQRREIVGSAKMEAKKAVDSGKIIFELKDINYQIEGKVLIRSFCATVRRGDKIALVGPNGCGKTTLLKLMLRQLKANSGTIHSGTKLELSYFDQHRANLNTERTVMDNIADGKQEVIVNGRSRHVIGYLQDFLFHPNRATMPVKVLSGGERNRLLLAKLFLQPSNLLIFDEPTNDLDVETLELLEELIYNYKGTMLLVSHDRQFIENSVTECWIFKDNGVIDTFIGGYEDAYNQHAIAKTRCSIVASQRNPMTKTKAVQPKKPSTKLASHLLHELEELPRRLERIEEEIKTLQAQISTISFFKQPHREMNSILTALTVAEERLEQAFIRWETLEKIKNNNLL